MLSIFVFIALATVLFADHSWGNVLSNRRNALVFEGRNQEYGAYRLRRENPRNVMWALFLTIGIALSALFFLGASGRGRGISNAQLTSVRTDLLPILLPKKEELQKKEEEPVSQEQPAEEPARAQGQTENLPPEIVEEGETEELQALVDPVEFGVPDGEENMLQGPQEDRKEGQQGGMAEKPKDYDYVTEMPSFPGGDEGKFQFVNACARYPQVAIAMGMEGTVLVSFVVDEAGKVTDVKVVRGVLGGKDLEREAVRVIEKMPLWSPGKMNGVPVRVRQVMPVKFTLRGH
jgi:protein TonB